MDLSVGRWILETFVGKSKKRSLLKCYLYNKVSLAVLGNVNIRLQLKDGCRVSVRKHNELVDKYGYIIYFLLYIIYIIDAITFCGELVLPCHDKTDETENLGNFRVHFWFGLQVAYLINYIDW